VSRKSRELLNEHETDYEVEDMGPTGRTKKVRRMERDCGKVGR